MLLVEQRPIRLRGEGGAAALDIVADDVDDLVRAVDRGGDLGGVAHIGRDRHDLADIAHGLEEQRLVRAAHGDADDDALGCQAPDDVSADEARSAENRGAPRRHEVSPTIARRPARPWVAERPRDCKAGSGPDRRS